MSGNVTQGRIRDVIRQGGRDSKLAPILVTFEHGKVDPDHFHGLKTSLEFDFDSDRKTPNIDLTIKDTNISYSNKVNSVAEVNLRSDKGLNLIELQ